MSQSSQGFIVQEIARHQSRLRALLRCLLVRSSDVDDVFQEINGVLWAKASDFQLGTDFWAWASQIARFKALNQIRKYSSERLVFESVHVISATPIRRWRSWLRGVTIEVDKETKSVRRLTIERESARHGVSTMTFTLVDSRLANESQYQAAGHLDEPYRILSREAMSDQRRELLNNWFGPMADRWIKSKELGDAAK